MTYRFITPDRYFDIKLDLNAPIGRGATARVFKFSENKTSYAAKIFTEPQKADFAKLTKMTELVAEKGYEFLQNHAWPVGLIQKDGKNIGFAMPLFDTKKFLSLDHFYDNILRDRIKNKDLLALPNLGLLCANLTEAILEFHKKNIHLVDVKPQNITVNLQSNQVVLLDCDGYSLTTPDGTHYPADLVSQDYISPEATISKLAPQKLGLAQDQYALSVLLFQILNRGLHPFAGRNSNKSQTANTNDEKAAAGLYPYGLLQNKLVDPHKSSLHHLWPEELRKAFDQSFQTNKRISAEKWHKLFSNFEVKKAYARCDKKKDDASHIRFQKMGCMQCHIDGLQSSAPPVPKKPEPASIAPIDTHSYKPPQPPPPQKQSGFFKFAAGATVFFVFVVWLAGFDAPKDSEPTLPTSTTITQTEKNKCWNNPVTCSVTRLCTLATGNNQNARLFWSTSATYQRHVSEAKKRKLNCGVKAKVTSVKKTCSEKNPEICSIQTICSKATLPNGSSRKWATYLYMKGYVTEAKKRKLNCGVTDQNNSVNQTCSQINPRSCTENMLCYFATSSDTKSWATSITSRPAVLEAEKRGLSCGVKVPNNSINSRTYKTVTYSNGKYAGQFKNNKRDGRGTYTWSNGDKYIGDWVNGDRTGKGTFTWADGDEYSGDYRNNAQTGKGTYTWDDGDKYFGSHKNGKFNGPGLAVSRNGEARFEKKFETVGKNWSFDTTFDKVFVFLKLSYNELSSDKRRKIQIKLKNKNMYKGSIDGLWGLQTFMGLVQFSSESQGRIDLRAQFHSQNLMKTLLR